MDFEKILRVARKNELTKKEPVKCLQTRFKPPTKEQHEKDKILSEGVQKFLARKELEEKKKQKEAERKKLELMALRAKDPISNKRIQTMLKRTKSANKSVLEDAVDNNNTADTLAGPSQPDEDDYGFVSETSSLLYNKLIQKMYSTPSNDTLKFAPSKKPSNLLSSTKERVKQALLRQEEEDKSPQKKKRRTKEKNEEDSASDRDINKPESEPPKEKPKIKKPVPPPVDFHELLKIAEQKQHEPIVFEPKIKKPEPEVLMTKKQKIEHERIQERKRQRELRLQNLENGDRSTRGQDEKKIIPKIPKLSQFTNDQKAASQKKINGCEEKSSNLNKLTKSPDKSDRYHGHGRIKDLGEKTQKFKSGFDRKVSTLTSAEKKQKDLDEETNRLIKERDDALKLLKEKEKLIRERNEAVRKMKEKEQLIKERDEVVRKLKLLEESEKLKSSAKSNLKLSEISKPGMPSKKILSDRGSFKNVEGASTSSSKIEFIRKTDSTSSKSSVPKTNAKPDSKSVTIRPTIREFPPRDVKPVSKPNRNLPRTKQFPPADVRRKAFAAKRRVIESDDEHDSDLDDFIDDANTDMGSEEVSKMISEIFKYDKNKYSKYDDLDDECMESNFAQISKEEYFSTKCGILEDLQDIRREKAMLARKQRR